MTTNKYRTVKMTALMDMTYRPDKIKKGETFMCRPADVKALKTLKRAVPFVEREAAQLPPMPNTLRSTVIATSPRKAVVAASPQTAVLTPAGAETPEDAPAAAAPQQTAFVTGVTTSAPADGKPAAPDDGDELEAARALYRELYKVEPDKRWGLSRLKLANDARRAV